MKRRQFLIAGSMGAAVAAVTRAGFAGAGLAGADTSAVADVVTGPGAGAEFQSSGRVRAVLYEPRYLLACEFANRHALSGIPVFGTDACMVRLWRGDLVKSIDGDEPRIGGLTLYSNFAMARDCARDHGLGVLHEAWCREAPRTLVSWLIGVA